MTAPGSSPLLIRNARIVTESGVIEAGTLISLAGNIDYVGPHEHVPQQWLASEEGAAGGGEWIDAGGSWLLPGFIDVHVHGGYGGDFMEATSEAYDTITAFHSRHGTTSILATSVTAPLEALERVLEAAHQYRSEPMPYARLEGVHLEGPFISPRFPGAQNPRYIMPPDKEWVDRMTQTYPGLIRIMTLAPEIDGAHEVIELLSERGAVPAAGHTDATFEQISEAASRGLCHAVHMFNAMRGLHHREPGTVGAVMTDRRISTELIADGHHVHPACIDLMVRLKTDANLLLITDAIAAAGLSSGRYELGGLEVDVQDGAAKLSGTDTLAGSTLTMIDAFRFTVQRIGLGVPAASALASGNPARLIGIADRTGSLTRGKQADLLLVSPSLELQSVYSLGRRIH